MKLFSYCIILILSQATTGTNVCRKSALTGFFGTTDPAATTDTGGTEGWAADTKVTFTCPSGGIMPGAATEGSSVLICGSDGSWTYEEGGAAVDDFICRDCNTDVPCEQRVCTAYGTCPSCAMGKAPDPTNPRVCVEITCSLSGDYTLDPVQATYSVSDVVTVTCNPGLVFQNGDDSVLVTCESSASFQPTPGTCVACTDSSQCTNGNCVSNACVCDSGYKLKTGSQTECELLACPSDDSLCGNYGTCYVDTKTNDLACNCLEGATGDQCDTYEDLCATNPCLHSGTCSMSTTNPKEFTCACAQGHGGDTCDEVTAFYIPTTSDGFVYTSSGDAITSAQITYVPAIGALDMYLVLLKVTDVEQSDATHKIVLVMRDDSSIEVIDTKADGTITKTLIENVDFTGNTETAVKIYKDASTKLAVDVAGSNEFVSSYEITTIDAFMFGGGLGDCAWDSTSDCGVVGATLNSAAQYKTYIGSFNGVTVNDEIVSWTDLSTHGAVTGAMTCASYTCANSGTCSDTDRISCACPSDDVLGFDCNIQKSVSFNGYTSTYAPTLPNIPLYTSAPKLTLILSLTKNSDTEIGQVLQLVLGAGCDITISVTAENKYKLGDTEFETVGSGVRVTFDGTNAEANGVTAACTLPSGDFLDGSSAVLSLGGSEPAQGSSVTLRDSKFQGCVSSVSLNNIAVLLTATSSAIDVLTGECKTDHLPSDPCDGNTDCQNGQQCIINLDTYHAKCDCQIPFVADETCGYKDYCLTASDNDCNANTDAATCVPITTFADCATNNNVPENCEEGKRWYYYCDCKNDYFGPDCTDLNGGWSAKTLGLCSAECTRDWTRTCTNPAPEGNGVTCADDAEGGASGTETCSADSDSCIALDIATDPASSYVEMGDTITLNCVSGATSVTVTKGEWVQGTNTVVDTTTDPPKDGSNIVTLNYEFTQSSDDSVSTSYSCQLTAQSGNVVTSAAANIYLTGIKSLTASYDGSAFESSEDGTVTLEVYTGPGIKSTTMTFAKAADSGTDIPITLTSPTTGGAVTTYQYTIETDKKVSGTYTATVVYDSVDSIAEKTVTKTLTLAVTELCTLNGNLPSVDNGSWNPSTGTIAYGAISTLVCNADYTRVGGNGISCGNNGNLDTTSVPSCELSSSATCTTLTDPANGKVVYLSLTKVKYSCNSGYALFNSRSDDDTYTCSNGVWSLVSKDNPYGTAPTCEEVIAAKSRSVTINMDISMDGITSGNADVVKAALKTGLEDENLITCTVQLKCTYEVTNFDYTSTSGTLSVTIVLTQTEDMADKTVVENDADRVKGAASEFTFSVNVGKKRATLSGSSTGVTTQTTTTCSTAEVLLDGSCVSSCPLGYGVSSGVCSGCTVANTYNGVSDTTTGCLDCTSGSITTQTLATSCVSETTLCIVPDLTHGSNNPPAGSKVAVDTVVTATCDTNYGVAFGEATTFTCNTALPTIQAITGLVTCYPACSTSTYTPQWLASVYIATKIDTTTPFLRNQEVEIVCKPMYEANGKQTNNHLCNDDGELNPSLDGCLPNDNGNGNWGQWTTWAPCADCEKTRSRQCNDPAPIPGGKECEGLGTETVPCEGCGEASTKTSSSIGIALGVILAVIVVVVLAFIGYRFYVKKQDDNAKSKRGAYSPQAEEKELELSGKADHVYSSPDGDGIVVQNPNAESKKDTTLEIDQPAETPAKPDNSDI